MRVNFWLRFLLLLCLTRVDVGLNLPGVKATKRLEESGSFNAMVTHRVRINGAAEVDEQLIGWLEKAYKEAG